jgi:hypothetical protein
MVSGKDPMVGREVMVTKGPSVEVGPGRRSYTGSSYGGYFGTIKSSSEGFNIYNVHLEATGTIVKVDRDIVVDRL